MALSNLSTVWRNDMDRLALLSELRNEAVAPLAPTPLHSWSITHKRVFAPVDPATTEKRTARWLIALLSGELPTPEDVARFTRDALADDALVMMLGSIAIHAVWEHSRLSSFEDARRVLMAGRQRPVDLEIVIEGALVMEFAAAHTTEPRAAATLLGGASLVWWYAGQGRRAAQVVRVAERLDKSPATVRDAQRVIKHRQRAPWMNTASWSDAQ